MCHAVLAVVSNCCPPLKGRFLTRYSPVRHCPLLQLDESSFRRFSFDLHVLSTPPAFVLSQDQTLRTKTIQKKPTTPQHGQPIPTKTTNSKTKNRHKNKHTIEFTNNTHTPTKSTQHPLNTPAREAVDSSFPRSRRQENNLHTPTPTRQIIST